MTTNVYLIVVAGNFLLVLAWTSWSFTFMYNAFTGCSMRLWNWSKIQIPWALLQKWFFSWLYFIFNLLFFSHTIRTSPSRSYRYFCCTANLYFRNALVNASLRSCSDSIVETWSPFQNTCGDTVFMYEYRTYLYRYLFQCRHTQLSWKIGQIVHIGISIRWVLGVSRW